MKRHFQYWGALYILAVLFIGSIAAQYIFQVVRGHGNINQFLSAIFENWQSEWAQLFVQALLIQGLGHLLYRKEMEDQERIEGKIDQLLEAMQHDDEREPLTLLKHPPTH
jgi:hypothetical protein